MSIVTLPADLGIGTWMWGQMNFDLSETSEFSGAQTVRVLGPARWTLSMGSMNDLSLAQAGVWEAFIASLKGRVNHLATYNYLRSAPQGTMRGTLTMSSTAAAGAETIVVTGGGGQAATTLKRGDFLQLGSGLGTSQLVMVAADATANGSGVITLSTQPALRLQFSAGAAVTWDKPLAYFKRTSNAASWSGIPGTNLIEGHAIDLMEQWA